MRNACTTVPSASDILPKKREATSRRASRTIGLLILTAGLAPLPDRSVYAHESGAPFSGAMIEPLVLHHAHLEDEQRLNLFSLRKLRAADTAGRHAFESELELAWANKDFTFGMELFVPFVSWPGPEGERHASVGDIEIRPIKYAFVNGPDFVISTATAIGLPTGDRTKQPESGNTRIAQHFFVDKAIGNWYTGGNVSIGRTVRGTRGTGIEYGIAVAYSFIEGATGAIAPAKPVQRLVVSPSIELIGERQLRGENAGEHSVSWLPGIALWWPRSGLQLRAGLKLPLSGGREVGRTFLLQVGAHRDWDAIFPEAAGTESQFMQPFWTRTDRPKFKQELATRRERRDNPGSTATRGSHVAWRGT